MIASVAFRNFKALRNTGLALAPFNLVIGPNGSGKTSLIQAVTRLRDLSALPIVPEPQPSEPSEGLEVVFRFSAPLEDVEARLACSTDFACDLLQLRPANPDVVETLRARLAGIRSYVLDHAAMAAGGMASNTSELVSDGRNLASVLAHRKSAAPEHFHSVQSEFCRILPEFQGLDFVVDLSGAVTLVALLADGSRVAASNLSQGTLYLLAMLTLTFDPSPATLLCIEEVDRGIHPRMLREVRDLMYRVSYPSSSGSPAAAVQIIATTHSPYLLDLFREHPEEVVIAQKHGTEARFERLSDRADLPELLQEGSLGDMWFAGILGGVPE